MSFFEEHNLVFGWRTALMLLFFLHLLIGAALLVRRSDDQLANRLLAMLLLVIAGMLTPQMIGFAGFYDAFPWLTFAPFDNKIAIGLLLYGYMHALVFGRLPWPGWSMAGLPVLYFLYQCYWFAQPLDTKYAWTDAAHVPYIQPAMDLAALASAVGAIVASYAMVNRYRLWLKDHSSATAEFDARWLPRCLIAVALPVLAWAAYDIAEAVMGHFTYFQRFPFYLVLAGAAYSIAFGALMQPRVAYPKMGPEGGGEKLEQKGRDWAAEAVLLKERVIAGDLYLEPRLTLTQLAREMATNETYLSRTINQGAGKNFNRFVNEIRIEAAKERLKSDSADILTIALDCGFNSKATFNRVFREIEGKTPSGYRQSALLSS